MRVCGWPGPTSYTVLDLTDQYGCAVGPISYKTLDLVTSAALWLTQPDVDPRGNQDWESKGGRVVTT